MNTEEMLTERIAEMTQEMIAVAEHLEALSVSWDRQAAAAKVGREANARKDPKHAEYCRGRAYGYLVAAGKIREALEV